MIKPLSITVSVAQESPYGIVATAIACEKDWSITVCGGTKHHVGGIATAYWESAQLQLHSFAFPSHKDHYVALMFAEQISRFSHTQTAVVAGIHVDDASDEEIGIMLQNSQSCCDLLLQKLAALKK